MGGVTGVNRGYFREWRKNHSASPPGRPYAGRGVQESAQWLMWVMKAAAAPLHRAAAPYSEAQTVKQVIDLILTGDDARRLSVDLRTVQQVILFPLLTRIRFRHILQQHH